MPSRFSLAPLAGYTHLPFRQSVRETGGLGLATTDLVNARAILEKSKKSMELLATCPADRPLSVQIFGGVPGEMARAAAFLEDFGATLIDINMGCPVRKVVKVGGGSAMMCDTSGGTIRLVEGVVDAVKIPVTVKMRLGWDSQSLTAPYFAREFEKIGVAAVTIHGRTREQGFTGGVDLDGIRRVVEAVEAIPVIGNGDVLTIADAERMMRVTGCAGIAIGRGALADPWIFRQLSNWLRTGDPGPRGTWEERIDFMGTHLRRLIDWRDEYGGCTSFRKVAAWYCKGLRVGKKVTHEMTQISTWDDYLGIVERFREKGQPADWSEFDSMEPTIAVPGGPIAHW